jgi:hypothetical protein
MDRGDALARLGLDEGATPGQVRAAYKKLGRDLKRSILAADTDEEKAGFRRELAELARCRDAALAEETAAPAVLDERGKALARLGLDAAATPFQVKAAYKSLSRSLKSRILAADDRDLKEKLRAELLELQSTREVALGNAPLAAPPVAPPEPLTADVLSDNDFKRQRRRIKARILEATDEEEKRALWDELEQLRRQRADLEIAPPPPKAAPEPERDEPEREPAPAKSRKGLVLVLLLIGLGAAGAVWGPGLWKKYGPQPRDPAAQARADEARTKAVTARAGWLELEQDGPADLPLPAGVGVAEAAFAAGEQRYADEQDVAAAAEFEQAETNYLDAAREREAALAKRHAAQLCDNERARLLVVMAEIEAMRRTAEDDPRHQALLNREILPGVPALEKARDAADEARKREEFADAAKRYETTYAQAIDIKKRMQFVATHAGLLAESPDTALRGAAAAGDEGAVRVLLALGADPNRGDPRPVDAAETPVIRKMIAEAGGKSGTHHRALAARAKAEKAREAYRAARSKDGTRIPAEKRKLIDGGGAHAESTFVSAQAALEANPDGAREGFENAAKLFAGSKRSWEEALGRALRQAQEDAKTTLADAHAARTEALRERKRYTDFLATPEGIQRALAKGGDPGAALLEGAERDLAAGKFGPAVRAFEKARDAYSAWLASD